MRSDWKICAVCGYPLGHDTNRIGQPGEWRHSRDDQQDHPPVPVGLYEIEFNQRCDFCDEAGATLIVLCTDFEMPLQVTKSVGHWAACETCGELVRRKRWSQLITHVKRNGTALIRGMTRR
jgi:hypothetical protein